MDGFKVGIIVAMPEELHPLLKRVGRVARENMGDFIGHTLEVAGRETCIIAAGMGTANAANAARTLVDIFRPQTLISAGFAGGITAGPKAGDIVIAETVLSLGEGRLSAVESADTGIADRVKTAVMNDPKTVGKTYHGIFVTASGIVNKQTLAGLLPPDTETAVVEMESAAVARTAAEEGVTFLGVRTISDAADEELGFGLDEFTDDTLSISVWRVLATVARKPWIIPQLIRLASNSRIAGRNLAAALVTVITTI